MPFRSVVLRYRLSAPPMELAGEGVCLIGGAILARRRCLLPKPLCGIPTGGRLIVCKNSGSSKASRPSMPILEKRRGARRGRAAQESFDHDGTIQKPGRTRTCRKAPNTPVRMRQKHGSYIGKCVHTRRFVHRGICHRHDGTEDTDSRGIPEPSAIKAGAGVVEDTADKGGECAHADREDKGPGLAVGKMDGVLPCRSRDGRLWKEIPPRLR